MCTPWIRLVYYMYSLLCSILVYSVVIILYDFGRGESTLVGRLYGAGTCGGVLCSLLSHVGHGRAESCKYGEFRVYKRAVPKVWFTNTR